MKPEMTLYRRTNTKSIGELNTIDYMDALNLNNSLSNQLTVCKNKIEDNKSWDMAKRLSNTYEFIFSSGYNKQSVSKKRPLSRAYFKLWEILHDFDYLVPKKEDDDYDYDTTSSSSSTPKISKTKKFAHIAEGPGGFIECLCDFTSKYSTSGAMYGITLKSPARKIPAWKIPRWQMEKHDIHLYNEDDGNLYNLSTVDKFVEYVGESSCEFVTADGGFDYSADFNNQETDSLMLMVAEIYTALRVQCCGGHLLLKVFDLFSVRTIKLMSICSDFYESFTVTKPLTSRPANSEKYIIFKNNVHDKQDATHVANLTLLRDVVDTNNLELLDTYTPFHEVLVSLTKYNVVYTSYQIDALEETLELSKNVDLMRKKNIDTNLALCRSWCSHYHLDT